MPNPDNNLSDSYRPNVEKKVAISGLQHRRQISERVPRELRLQWTNRSEEVKNSIINVFRTRQGLDSFPYQVPGENTTHNYVATEWTVTRNGQLRNVSATLEEQF